MPSPSLDESGLLLSSRVTNFSIHFTQTNVLFSSMQQVARADQLLARLEQQCVSLLGDKLSPASGDPPWLPARDLGTAGFLMPKGTLRHICIGTRAL